MFTDSTNHALLYAFALILIPSTGLLFRYAWKTQFWSNPAGKAFFLIISTSWLNYMVSAISAWSMAWSVSTTGVAVRVVSRILIAGALAYAWWVYERAQRHGRTEHGFTGAPRTPGGGIDAP